MIVECPSKRLPLKNVEKSRLHKSGLVLREQDLTHSVRCLETIDNVVEFVLSQEDKPQCYSTQREIWEKLHISLGSVNIIIIIVKQDLGRSLKCFKKCRSADVTTANKDACFAAKLRSYLPELLIAKTIQYMHISCYDFIYRDRIYWTEFNWLCLLWLHELTN